MRSSWSVCKRPKFSTKSQKTTSKISRSGQQLCSRHLKKCSLQCFVTVKKKFPVISSIGSRWTTKVVTYAVRHFPVTALTDPYSLFQVVSKAFSLWQKHTDLRFEYSNSDEVDIELYFLGNQHGDRMRFDNVTVAHAFYPEEGGNIHLSANHNWTGKCRLWTTPSFLYITCMYSLCFDWACVVLFRGRAVCSSCS